MSNESRATTLDAARAMAHAGKHLTFKLGEEVFGLEILKVQEIIGLLPVTAVPRTPAYVRGIINLRGKVIPVVDLRLKFDMPAHEDTERTCIIVINVFMDNRPVTMGIIVDEVSEVLDIKETQLEPPPSFGALVNTEFLLGVGKVGEKVVMLLDADRVFAVEEMALGAEA